MDSPYKLMKPSIHKKEHADGLQVSNGLLGNSILLEMKLKNSEDFEHKSNEQPKCIRIVHPIGQPDGWDEFKSSYCHVNSPQENGDQISHIYLPLYLC